MNQLQATAHAKVTGKSPWYTRRRYTLSLFVNNINTGLHWHVKRSEINSLSQAAVANCAELLDHYGLMDAVFAQVHAGDLNLPARGSKVRIKEDIGPFKAGQVGTVAEVEPQDDSYPLMVALASDKESAIIPMSVTEVEAV